MPNKASKKSYTQPSKGLSVDKAVLKNLLAQGLAFHQRGQFAQAKSLYEQVLAKQALHFDALHLLGLIWHQEQNHPQAAHCIEQALHLQPQHAVVQSNLGLVYLAMGRLQEALTQQDKAIALDPTFVDAHIYRGNVLLTLSRLEQALESYSQAIVLHPTHALAYAQRGNVYKSLGRLEQALQDFSKALTLQPNNANTCNNLAMTQLDLGLLDLALVSCEQALALNPKFVQAHVNRGNVFLALSQPEMALQCFDQALALDGGYASAHSNRGIALKTLNRLDLALQSYDRAIELAPDFAHAHNHRGNSLKLLKRYEEALHSLDQAIALQPDYANAHNNRAHVLLDLKRWNEALQSFERAHALAPEIDFMWGQLLHLRMQLCLWQPVLQALPALEASLIQGQKVSAPFAILGLVDDPALQRQAAHIYAQAKFPSNDELGPLPVQRREGKIRVGYYSADFHNHATACLIAQLLETHDSSRFELYGFSFGPDRQDAMRERVQRCFQQFLDVRLLSDREVAQRSRELEIDIAVDLKGYTQDSRSGIFAYRCAPVQVNYLGYPGTMAAPYMDYIIADRVLINPEQAQHYSEKVVYLPGSYQVNDASRVISEREYSRQELGLPQTGFVFCCFNNNYKITAQTFELWMQILQAVPGSVLWLFEGHASAAENLRSAAQQLGVAPQRLVFAPNWPLPEHLARHRAADLFLDTWPYNAHTTASDALWAGLPVLTLAGRSFAARVAASLLSALGLPELVVDSPAAYVDLAVNLARTPSHLLALKQRLAHQTRHTGVFDGALFARHLEAAYVQMHQRQVQGLAPQPIEVHALNEHPLTLNPS